jgi:hypothetical protein
MDPITDPGGHKITDPDLLGTFLWPFEKICCQIGKVPVETSIITIDKILILF